MDSAGPITLSERLSEIYVITDIPCVITFGISVGEECVQVLVLSLISHLHTRRFPYGRKRQVDSGSEHLLIHLTYTQCRGDYVACEVACGTLSPGWMAEFVPGPPNTYA